MASQMGVFIYNRAAIEERVLGAVIQYFLVTENGNPELTKFAFQKAFSVDYRVENLVAYYQYTLDRVAKYFSTQSTTGAWSDFQCNLALSIYSDYVK